jgi:integrase
MSVYPKGKYYHYDFQFKGRRYAASTGCTTKRNAETVERRVRDEVALGTRRRKGITVNEACGLYQERAEKLPSWPTTRYILGELVKGVGPQRLLSEVDQRDFQNYYRKRAEGRAASTINREIDVARAVWEYAEKTRYDVGEKLDWRSLRRKEHARPDRELSPEEERRLFEHLRKDLRDAVDFLLKSGWRRNEVLNLRWSDCDLQQNTAITRIKGGDVVRRVLNEALASIIARQPKACDYVFTFVCQRPREGMIKGARYHLTPTALRKPFADAKRDAGINGFRLHDLRHTRATRIVRSTGSLLAAKAALAHKSITTTQRYAHATDDDTRRALDASESRNSPEANLDKSAES